MSYRREVIHHLETSGYKKLPNRGKGSHEVWRKGERVQIVPHKIDDRNFANDIMKQAGIAHRFK
jgi:predicted RNA binding protein YcfA (HicA-like mRNA interferase family)